MQLDTPLEIFISGFAAGQPLEPTFTFTFLLFVALLPCQMTILN